MRAEGKPCPAGGAAGRAADRTVPAAARVRNVLMGSGKDSYTADRDLAARLLSAEEGYPGLRRLALAHRAFITAAARWAARRRGITQVIVAGAGYPLTPPLHEAVRAARPGVTVVYADADPVVLSHHAALSSGPGLGCAAVPACEPGELLAAAAQVTDTAGDLVIRLAAPAAVLLMSGPEHLPSPRAAGVIRGYAAALAPGSVIAAGSACYPDAAVGARVSRLFGEGTGCPQFTHDPAAVAGWLAGAGLADPDGGPVQAADVRFFDEGAPYPFPRWAVTQVLPAREPHVTGAAGVLVSSRT